MKHRASDRAHPKIERIRRVRLFASCGRQELARVASLVDEAEVPAGTVLTRESSRAMQAFIVVHGYAAMSIGTTDAAVVGPGAFIGEVAMLDPGPHTATATALTSMGLLVLDPRSFATLIDDVPAVGVELARCLAARLRAVHADLATSGRLEARG